jgi:hypothetical protein
MGGIDVAHIIVGPLADKEKGTIMVTYRKRRHSSAWIIGLMVFVLAMTITLSDVYGLERFVSPTPGNLPTDAAFVSNAGDFDIFFSNHFGSDCSDPEVPLGAQSIPEPASLTLLVLGCGLIAARRMKRKL